MIKWVVFRLSCFVIAWLINLACVERLKLVVVVFDALELIKKNFWWN